MMRPLPSLLLAAALLACPTSRSRAEPGPADPSQEALEEGRERFQRGVELYREGNFEAALAEFRRGYEAAPSYRFLFNMGQVQFALRDYAGALQSFEQYLVDGGDDIPAERRAEVTQEIEKLRGRVATLTITVDAEDAEILVDDVVVGLSPLTEPVVVSAGRRKISASRPGMPPVVRRIEVAGGDTLRVELDLAPTPAPPAEPPPPPRRPEAPPSEPAAPADASSVGPWVGLAVTGALAAGTAVVGALALSSKAAFEEQLETYPNTVDAIDSARTELQALAAIADGLAAGTAVAAGITIYLLVTADDGAVRGPTAARLQLGFGPTRLGLGGSF